MRNIKSRILASIMSVVILMSIFTGCSEKYSDKDLFSNIQKSDFGEPSRIIEDNASIMDFSINLLKTHYSGKNTLLAPNSLFCALTMVANGSEDITREEFEDLFGMTVEEANEYVYIASLNNDLINSVYADTTHSANAIWINDKNKVKFDKDYLQTMADYFDSNVYYESFDLETLANINNFVNENTYGMIPEVMGSIDGDAPLILINSQYFADKWTRKFDKDETKEGIFTNIDNSESEVQFMSMVFNNQYVETNNGYGIYMTFNSGRFVALMPNEGTDFDEFIAGLDADHLYSSPDVGLNTQIETTLIIPKFEMEFDIDLNDTLMEMGLESAFNNSANFSGMTTKDNPFYISTVGQVSTIGIDEEGITAAVATHLQGGGSGHCDEIIYNDVIFDRPFVYFILDLSGNPLFIGVITDMG